MAQYDRRFVRPSVHQLLEALTEASSRASSHWQGVLERIREVPEGFEQWRDGGVASLAWWTDAERRRHFRVQGCTADDPEFARVCWPSDQEMSPLWHVYPEYVFHRARGRRTDWIMVCSCGVIGDPASSHWMGDRCHWCHTRPHYAPERPPGGPFGALPIDGGKSNVLAVSGDGFMVAVASAEGGADVWYAKTHTQMCHLDTGPTAPRLHAFTPDNMHLAVTGDDRTLRILHVLSGQEDQLLPAPRGLRQIKFAADGNLLVMVGTDSTEIWDRAAPPGEWRFVADFSLPVEDAAVSASGEWVALAAGEVLLLLKHLNQAVTPRWMLREPEVRYRRVAFQTAGWRYLLAARTRVFLDAKEASSSCEIVHWWVGSSAPPHPAQHLAWAENAVLSPKGHWLVTPNASSVRCDDLSQKKSCATYKTDPRSAVTSLAFSADEKTLAVTDDSGRVYLWPWARMW
jgi:hypothetical protein